jgi:hypothetical protein
VRWGKCGPPATTWSRAPGMVSARRRDIATVGKWSCEPAMMRAGQRMRAQSASQSAREYVSSSRSPQAGLSLFSRYRA